MLIPRFSIRTYFVATVLFAIFSLVLGCAIDGQVWAKGVVVGIMSAVVALGLYALAFAVAWLFVERYVARHAQRPASPFAGEDPPKQILPPMEL